MSRVANEFYWSNLLRDFFEASYELLLSIFQGAKSGGSNNKQEEIVRRKLKIYEGINIYRRTRKVFRLLRFSVDKLIQNSNLMTDTVLMAVYCLQGTVLDYSSDKFFVEELKKSVCFFLEHSRLTKMLIWKCRLPDLMLSLLRQREYRGLDADVLTELLRYGTLDLLESPSTDSSPAPKCKFFGDLPLLPYPLVDLTAHLLIKVHRHARRTDIISRFKIIAYVRILRIVIQAMNRFPREHLGLANGDFFKLSLKDEKVKESLNILNDEVNFPHIYLPEVAENAGLKVTSLRHLCRAKIRKCLYLSWNLPHGIYELGLPVTLVNYLDLM